MLPWHWVYDGRRMSAITMFLVWLLVCLFFPLGGSAQEHLKQATFIPQWSPQAQFAGYYVAYEKGLYRKYGIALKILQGGPNRPPVKALESGEADFASLWLSTAIEKRSEGVKLVNICQVMQRSALMLIAKKGRGINRPEDINGRKVGLWGGEFQLQPKAFLKKYNLKVTIIPQSYSVNLFLRDGVDVASAMWYNEYHTIINSGINPDELTTFFFHQHGLNFPEDGIYTLEKTFARDPALNRAFVKASMEGWLYAFNHPDEALDIVLAYMSKARVPANRVHQKWMLARMKDLILPEDLDRGSLWLLQEQDFLRVAGELKKAGLIKDVSGYRSFCVRCEADAGK